MRVPEWAGDSSEVDEDVSRQPVQRWGCSVGGGRVEFVGVSRGQRRPRWRWMDRAGRYGLGLGARGGTGAAGSWGAVERAGIILRAADGRQLNDGGVCVLRCGEEGSK